MKEQGNYTMGEARLRVSYAVIEAALHMPSGDEIIRASDDCPNSGWVEFIVRSPDFPEVAEGEEIPLVWATIRRERVKFKWEITSRVK